jgi:hypothetical protein
VLCIGDRRREFGPRLVVDIWLLFQLDGPAFESRSGDAVRDFRCLLNSPAILVVSTSP